MYNAQAYKTQSIRYVKNHQYKSKQMNPRRAFFI